jgi:sec-independent protein translocase protein TatA
MFGLGMGELLIIGAVVVLFFGAKRLPGLGKSMGSAIGEFKKGLKESKDDQDGSES